MAEKQSMSGVPCVITKLSGSENVLFGFLHFAENQKLQAVIILFLFKHIPFRKTIKEKIIQCLIKILDHGWEQTYSCSFKSQPCCLP